MRKLTFEGFLKQYVVELSGVQTASVHKLADCMTENPRLKEPLYLYALAFDKVDLLLRYTVNRAVAAEYEQLSNRYSLAQMLLLLENQSPELTEGYLKVWRSYCSVRDTSLADNDTKALIHRRVLELQRKKKLTNYRLYTDLKLNPGNVNAWLKHNDSSKMSLDCARQIYKYAKSYSSVRQEKGSESMTAVIYARYSSDNQRKESIEGQIRECTAYAEKNGITVIKHYIDRAFSAKTDNRPEFQQMIKDSGKKLFDVVLVWKFDRFARNRFDSANYKMILKKNGVHLISVMEPIAEGSQGILVETLLEGMAEYYSAELSEKVIRGQTENALKGKCTGGTGTIGYKIDDAKFYHLDPLTAPLVLEAFQRYDNGEKMVEIVNFLNDKGVRNMQGGKMTHSSVNTMLKNRRYIGELSFRDIVVPDAIPAIVPKDLFDRVQKRMDKNKRAPACGKADEEYLLTTKLFCGKCGALMFGESGTSATGRTYYYYKCASVKRRKGCNKKTVQKDWLEDLVVRETMKLIQDDAVIDKIVQLVMDVQNQENTTIPLLEKQLREVNKKLDNLMKAIEDGLYTRTTKERLEALEIQKDELTAKIADEKLKKPSFNEDFIRFWLMKFRKFDISQKKQRKALIEIFVNAIFLYDDRMLITFNYKDGTQTVRFEDTLTADSAEEKSSDLSSLAGP